MAEAEYVLSVRNISKRFATAKVLDGVSLDVRAGEVHALVGENGAGKSTLMNIVSGVHQKDEGEIYLNGQEVKFTSPRQACLAGIGFVHQEMSLCMHMSVAENVYMWNIPQKNGLVEFKKLYNDVDQLLQKFGANFSAKTKVGDLTIAQQQVVEIARALSMNAKLIIFDEPTSSLTEEETENLFRFISILKKNGVGIIYISHRMPEIFRICDRATILRDGRYVDTVNVKDVTADEIVLKMVGRSLGDYYPPKSSKAAGKELLSVKDVTGTQFKNISFTLHQYEILGFSGLVGSGRSEVMRAICGFDRYESGEVRLLGETLHARTSSNEIIRRGMVYLTEDRKKNGLFLNMTTRRNISVTILRALSHYGMMDDKEEKKISDQMIKEMDVRVSSDQNLAGSMSGGNQQKVMIAKWLASHPQIIIMDEPTRGIDVGSKSEIHHKLRQLCENGIGVIVISSELPEIIGVCDRVVVMHEGQVVGEASGDEINEENLMLMAANQRKEV